MALSLTILDHWSDTKRIHLVGYLMTSGSYPLGGDPVPLTNPLIKSGSSPIVVIANGLGGYNYVVTSVPFAVPAAATLRVYVDSTGVELPAGAYPASSLANQIQFYAVFPKYI